MQAPTTPSTTFIIPTFKYFGSLKTILKEVQLIAQKYKNSEIILIDDASPKETIGYLLKNTNSSVRLLFNKNNVGFAQTCNNAASQASNDLLIFLNSDIEFCGSTDWYEAIVKNYLEHKDNFGLSGAIHLEAKTMDLNHAGVDINLRGELVHIKTKDNGNEFSQVFAISGAVLAIEKKIFDSIGGFEKQFNNGCEDVDLCLRVRQMGKTVMICNRSIIKHHVSKSRGLNHERDARNSLRLYQKWEHVLSERLSCTWASYLSKQDETKLKLIYSKLKLSNCDATSTHFDRAAKLIAKQILTKIIERLKANLHKS